MLPKDYKPGETLHLMVALHGSGGDGWEYFKHPDSQCRATPRPGCQAPSHSGRTRLPRPPWMGPKADEDVAQIIRDVKDWCKVGKVFVVGAFDGGAPLC